MTTYGHFDDQQREYVITRPDTPLPWINYLGCESYFGIISNTAGGYSFYKDARLRRLTRYRYNNAPLDMGGRYIYIRDDAAADPLYWSPSWMPVRRDLDAYECRHGLGYTTIHAQLAGIHSTTRYFIPLGENLEVWELTLTNQRQQPAELSVYSAVEFCLWDAQDDATNFQRNYSVGEVEVADGVIYHKTEYRERRNHFAFLACSEPLTGFDTQRSAFLGPYRGWDAPLTIEQGQLTNSLATGWQPVGTQQVRLTLQPGEVKKVIFLLGYSENDPAAKFDPPTSQVINKTHVKPVIARYLQPQEVENAFQTLGRYNTSLLEKLQVTTPCAHTDRMVNIWNAYQMMVTFNFSRSASYFESGIGRGMGFRDSNQDLLGFMHLNPPLARTRILDLAATQLPSGGAYHQYQTLTRRGNNDIGSNFNDDPLWLVLSTAAYIKETGDWSILDESVPYDNTPGTEENLAGHLRRSIGYTLKRLGSHQLPLIGRADWNDCLNLNCYSDTPGQSFQTTTNKEGKNAESVFIAGLFVLAATEMVAIANHLQQDELADTLKKAISNMENAVNQSGWDGDWFRRAYDDLGRPVGSHECDEGQIFIEPQGICVMAGLGLNNGRATQALNAVATKLATPHGIVLLQPPFTRYYLHLGEISSYPPGYKENGSVFSHTNPWIMIAETRLGHGDTAHDYYLRINPSACQTPADVRLCEPYVYPQMIAGPTSNAPGEAKNSWLTGAAAWNYAAITQSILGIRPDYNGLLIDPCIPSSWDGFAAVRHFRGATCHIVVRNPRHVCRGVASLTLNGQPIPVGPIPLTAGQDYQIEVTLGQ